MANSLKDVAMLANTSVTTVSLVLNNKPVRVSDEKRKQILEAVKELDYKPNETAKSLRLRKSMTIGVIVPDIRNIFFSELVRNIGIRLRALNYSLLLCNSDNKRDEDIYQMELFRAKSVDGILAIFSDTETDEYEAELRKLKDDCIPIVVMDRKIDGIDIPYMGVDNKKGGYIATKYLIDNNHRNIACIKGVKYSISSEQRFQGYQKAMQEAGLPIKDNFIFNGNFEFESGKTIASEIVKYPEITAVFAENDMMALGLYMGLSQMGIKVGRDISIIGFDDIVFSSMLETPLTTINQNVKEVADKAVDLLLATIQKKRISNIKNLIEPKLVVRNTVSELKR